ncbi:putative Aldehyde dehydrogenase protein [Naja naja]|nr:putative Aldehyde dehydrogenase protein [Naja naja]
MTKRKRAPEGAGVGVFPKSEESLPEVGHGAGSRKDPSLPKGLEKGHAEEWRVAEHGCRLKQTTMEKLKRTVEQARAAFNTGKTRPLAFRIQQLKALKKMVQENEKEFSAAMKADLNKSELNSFSYEIMIVLGEIDLFLEKLPEWASPQSVEKTILTLSDKTYIHREPLGVTLVIGAWNYPFVLIMGPLLAAIAAGNAVVIKPSEISETQPRCWKSCCLNTSTRTCIRWSTEECRRRRSC